MVLVGTSAYTSPTFTMAEGTMTVVADRWFPRPNVTWMDHDQKVLQSTTSMTENSAGIFSLVSSLPQVNTSETYTVRIYNQLVQSVSRARIAGTLGWDGGLGGWSGGKQERSWFQLFSSRIQHFRVFVFRFQQSAARANALSPQPHRRCCLHLRPDVTTHTLAVSFYM